MNSFLHKPARLIFFSLVLSFILAILPLPGWANWLRPNWVLLTLICWSLMLPDKAGVGAAWICGFLLDIFSNSTLGEHALIFTLTIYLVIKFQSRINFFPFWQKLSIISGLILLSQTLQFWIISAAGQTIDNYLYWSTVLTSTLFWPWTLALLKKLQGDFGISKSSL